MIRNNTTNVSNLSAILNFSEKKEILTEIGVNIWIRDGENKIVILRSGDESPTCWELWLMRRNE